MHEEVRLKPPDPRARFWFFVCTAGTMCIVLVGWWFSFRDTFRSFSFDLPVEQVTEFREGVRDITADFSAKATAPTIDVQEVIQEATAPIVEGVEQREEALDTVTGIMKERLEEDSASETPPDEPQKDTETPVAPEIPPTP